jgi:hypothetical protein
MKYDTERGLIINPLSEEVTELALEIEKERELHGFTAQYRALSKTYNDTSKHYLSLVRESENEASTADALTEFNKI